MLPNLVDGPTGVSLLQNRHDLSFGDVRLPYKNLMARSLSDIRNREKSDAHIWLRINDRHVMKGPQISIKLGHFSNVGQASSDGYCARRFCHQAISNGGEPTEVTALLVDCND